MENLVEQRSYLDQEELMQSDYGKVSKGIRLVHLIVDFIALNFIGFFAGLFWFILVDLFSSISIGPGETASLSMALAPLAINIAIILGYYIGMEAIWGKTIGKFLTKTKVVSRDGSKASFNQIVGRSFARLIPIEVFSFLFGENGWHDSWSETMVVNENP